MKNILVLSDTHNFIDKTIMDYANQADQVWHAGDIGSYETINKLKNVNKLVAIYGNIDGQDIRMSFPKDIVFTCEGKTIYMIHISGKYPNYSLEVSEKLKKHKPNIFICGHSHILKIAYNQNYKILHINPGAAGIYGFHQKRTMLKFQINNGEIENMNIIEIEKK